MRLEHLGSFLELRVVGYPGEINDNNDWIDVEGSAGTDHVNWTFRSTCLVAGEFITLVAWLRAIADGRDGILDHRIDFIEPTLAFEFVRIDPTTVKLKVEFAVEAAPPGWAADSIDPYVLPIEATSKDLARASADLAATASALVERAARHGRFIT
jgi:hypothetical protein